MIGILRQAGVPTLVVTSLIGRLPTAMSSLALVRLVVDTDGGYSYASALTATFVIAGTIGQPLLGRVVDLTGRRTVVLVIASVMSTIGFALVAVSVASHPVVAFPAAGLAGLATPPIESTLRSLWPTIFPDEKQRASAYAVDAAAIEVLFIIGPLLTAAGIALFGARLNVLAMAAIGLLGGVAYAAGRLVRHGGRGERTAGRAPRRHGSPLASAPFRRLLILVVAAAMPVGALTLTATAYAAVVGDDRLGPIALAANAAGALVGALAITRFPLRMRPSRAVGPLAMIVGTLYLPTATAELPPVGWIAMAFAAGITLPPLLTQVFALTPELVQPRHANEANAWVVSVFAIGIAAGTIVGGVAVDVLGAPPGILAAVLISSAVAILGGAQAAARRTESAT